MSPLARKSSVTALHPANADNAQWLADRFQTNRFKRNFRSSEFLRGRLIGGAPWVVQVFPNPLERAFSNRLLAMPRNATGPLITQWPCLFSQRNQLRLIRQPILRLL